jgi:hypothetical protein
VHADSNEQARIDLRSQRVQRVTLRQSYQECAEYFRAMERGAFVKLARLTFETRSAAFEI